MAALDRLGEIATEQDVSFSVEYHMEAPGKYRVFIFEPAVMDGMGHLGDYDTAPEVLRALKEWLGVLE